MRKQFNLLRHNGVRSKVTIEGITPHPFADLAIVHITKLPFATSLVTLDDSPLIKGREGKRPPLEFWGYGCQGAIVSSAEVYWEGSGKPIIQDPLAVGQYEVRSQEIVVPSYRELLFPGEFRVIGPALCSNDSGGPLVRSSTKGLRIVGIARAFHPAVLESYFVRITPDTAAWIYKAMNDPHFDDKDEGDLTLLPHHL